jgi:hypothetical protein
MFIWDEAEIEEPDVIVMERPEDVCPIKYRCQYRNIIGRPVLGVVFDVCKNCVDIEMYKDAVKTSYTGRRLKIDAAWTEVKSIEVAGGG